jgi:putative ABC transport system substrate-binding protein
VKRRKFIALLGGAATWPLATRAQQPAMPVIGFLDSRPSDAISDRLRAFRHGLKDTGYVEGENVAIIHRFAENQVEGLLRHAPTGWLISASPRHRHRAVPALVGAQPARPHSRLI